MERCLQVDTLYSDLTKFNEYCKKKDWGIMIDDTIAAVWAMIPLLFLTYRTNLL